MAKTRERQLDFILLAAIVILFMEGYTAVTPWVQTEKSLTNPLLMMAGFFGVMYPFRLRIRLTWIAVAPFFVFAIPTLGYNVNLLLNTAPGLQERYWGSRRFFLALAYYVVSTGLWLLPGVLGWTLQKTVGPEPNSRTFGLRPIFFLTGLVCCLMVVFRDTYDPVTYESSPTWLLAIHLALMQFFMFGLPIWAGLSRRWTAALFASLLSFIAVCAYEWVLTKRLPMYQIQGLNAPSYWSIVASHFWQVAVLLVGVLAIRFCGFRLVEEREPEIAGQ